MMMTMTMMMMMNRLAVMQNIAITLGNITSHHIEEADAGLDRPLYLRNKCSDKTLKSQKLLI